MALKLQHLEIHINEEQPGEAFFVIPSGLPDEEEEVAVLGKKDVALAAAYLLRIAEEGEA